MKRYKRKFDEAQFKARISTWDNIPSDWDFNGKEIEKILNGFENFYRFINSVTFNRNNKMIKLRKLLDSFYNEYQMNIVSAIKDQILIDKNS